MIFMLEQPLRVKAKSLKNQTDVTDLGNKDHLSVMGFCIFDDFIFGLSGAVMCY